MENDIKNIIEEFFAKMSFDISDISSSLDMDSGAFWFSLQSKDSYVLVGRAGETLQTINYLIKRIIENKYKENTPMVTVDINGHQKAKIEKLKTVAHMMSERARFFKSKVELDPMNGFERRIIHEHVANLPDLESESEGYGRDRHVTIKFVEKKSL